MMITKMNVKKVGLPLLYCCIILLPGTPQAGSGYCSFPPFIWTPVISTSNSNNNNMNRNRKWLSGMEYRENSDTWVKQKEITAMESEIIIHHKIYVSCDDTKSRKLSSCYKQTLIYRMICIQEEPDGKYRVHKESNGKYQFSCLEFLPRGQGVLQLYSASPKDTNDAKLCYSLSLHRQEWPWIDPAVTTWHPCPLVGGFDFRASYLTSKTKESCSEDWLPSRVESECILGEGMIFTFPNTSCNPFNASVHEQYVQCRAVWQEAIYTFYLLSEADDVPRYTLRLPRDTSQSTMTAHLYLSAVTPMSGLGQPPGDVMAVSMQMRRSDTGTCYDESESCAEFAQQGKCRNTAFHTFASHCVKSCGLCDMAPKNSSECFFDESLDGTWYMFDDHRKDKVTIRPHVVHFAELGSFYCKSRHWSEEFYKTLSIFSNGCRPRYSCLELVRSNSETLQYRMSHSSLSDHSFALCSFTDDPLPVGDKVRSAHLKTLIGAKSIDFEQCGLSMLVHINVTITPSTHCDGTLSDIQPKSCVRHNRLTLSLHQCPAFNYKVLQCEASHFMTSQSALLVTNATHTRYQCFMVRFQSSSDTDAWNIELVSIHCSSHRVITDENHTGLIQRITSYADKIDHPCSGAYKDPHKPVIDLQPPASSTSTTITHTTPLSAGRHQHIGSRKRIRTHILRSSDPDLLDYDLYIDYPSASSASFISWQILLVKILYFSRVDFIFGIIVYYIII